MSVSLECKVRPDGSKANALRQAGSIPAVLYGHKGTESLEIVVDAKTAKFLLRDASINNTLIDLSIPELPWKGQALLRDVHVHPAKGSLYHLSFFSIASQDSLDVVLPVHLVGESPGVRFHGGGLDLQISEIRIRCAPDKIPAGIDIDVSELNVGDALHVRELKLPKGVEALEDADGVVVSVLPPRVSEEPESAEP